MDTQFNHGATLFKPNTEVIASRLGGTMLLLSLLIACLAANASAREACNTTTTATAKETTPTTKPYRILSSKQIKEGLESLEIRFPTLIHVETAQGKYGLSVAGNESDCRHDDGKGCLNYFATIQDFVVHPIGSESSKQLPAVLLSGALHGDERVGPTAVMETAKIILRAASCEADLSATCKASLLSMGITDRERRWLARLVTTRRLVIVPTANALGYDRNQREEDFIDVNRDFPFDVLDSRECMQSVAARTMNELFRDDQFQMAVTFHAGMEMIGFEWGAESYVDNPVSPDDQVQYEVARGMSQFGGSFPGTPAYPYGIMNTVVYPVRGGMEDWAYAGSWDKPRTLQCQPETNGGYPTSKTSYNSGTLRSFILLVETSNDKSPSESTLGSPRQILKPQGRGSGHVSRNVRIALLALDMVQPYVVIRSASGEELARDLVPKQPRLGRSCMTTRNVKVPDRSRPSISWTVGGTMSVDETQVWVARWKDLPESKFNCLEQPTVADVEKYMVKGNVSTPMSGSGRFSPEGETLFRAKLDLDAYSLGDELMVLVGAKVDSGWAAVPAVAAPGTVGVAQTHIVQARTNSSWVSTDNGKVVKGREVWYASPLTLTVVED